MLNFAFANGKLSPKDIFRRFKKNGFYKRDKSQIIYDKERLKYEKMLMKDFYYLIDYLKKNNNKYDFVLRPHPVENLNYWTNKFNQDKKVIIDNSGPINKAIHDSFCIINNSCTSSIEATVSNVPVINFVPNYYKHEYGSLANKIGIKGKNFSEVSKILKKLENKKYNHAQKQKSKNFIENKIFYKFNNSETKDMSIYFKKIYLKKFNLQNSKFSVFKIKIFIFLYTFFDQLIRDLVLIIKNKRNKIKEMTNYKLVYFDRKDTEIKLKLFSKKINFRDYKTNIINNRVVIITKN